MDKKEALIIEFSKNNFAYDKYNKAYKNTSKRREKIWNKKKKSVRQVSHRILFASTRIFL